MQARTMPNIAPALNPSLVFSSTHKIISNQLYSYSYTTRISSNIVVLTHENTLHCLHYILLDTVRISCPLYHIKCNWKFHSLLKQIFMQVSKRSLISLLSLQLPSSSTNTPAHLVHSPIALWSLALHCSQFRIAQPIAICHHINYQ